MRQRLTPVSSMADSLGAILIIGFIASNAVAARRARKDGQSLDSDEFGTIHQASAAEEETVSFFETYGHYSAYEVRNLMQKRFGQLEQKSKMASSDSHALAYCVVSDYIDTMGRRDNGFLLWSMCFDRENLVHNWFRPENPKEESISTWLKACGVFGGTPGDRPFKKDMQGTELATVVRARQELCDSKSIRASPQLIGPQKFKGFSAMLADIYRTYEEKETDPALGPGHKPYVFFAAGPPSSGKSLSFIGEDVFKMVKDETKRKDDVIGALNGVTYQQFQKNTAKVNIDSMVGVTDIQTLLKKVHADVQRVGQMFSEEYLPLLNQSLGPSPGSEDFAAPFKETVSAMDKGEEHIYWTLRKALCIDDLNNAHEVRLLGEGHSIIYESVFGNRFLDWGVSFALPRMKAIGHEMILLLFQVPIETLLKRLQKRQEKTGQKPAPEKQVRSELIEAQNNFASPAIREAMQFGIAMSHQRFETNSDETLLAAFSKSTPEGSSCFTKCASQATLNEWNLGEIFGKPCKDFTCNTEETGERQGTDV